MPLATILGVCLLLPWLQARIVPSVPAIAIWQSTQPQDQTGNSPQQSLPQQSSPAPPPTDQQESHDQSVAPSPPPAATSPCPQNSQPGSTTGPECKPSQSTTKTRKHHRPHKAAAPAGTSPAKTVVRNGGTADPTVDLSPGLSKQQVSRQSESTKLLLAHSDADLKQIAGRQLNSNQQDTVKQIKSYLEQANKALIDGDVQRAHNLAVKANLLLVELLGH
jgi:hypothetical protein